MTDWKDRTRMGERGARRQWKMERKRGEKLDRGSMHVIGKGGMYICCLHWRGRGYPICDQREVVWIWYWQGGRRGYKKNQHLAEVIWIICPQDDGTEGSERRLAMWRLESTLGFHILLLRMARQPDHKREDQRHQLLRHQHPKIQREACFTSIAFTVFQDSVWKRKE